MPFIVLIFSIYTFVKTISYGIFELKNNSNKFVGITIFIIGIFSLIVPNIVLH